jgi:hypothetical protein
MVSGGGGEYVFWRGASGIFVSGRVADIFGDFFGAGNCGCGRAEVAAVVGEKLSSAAEDAVSRVDFMSGAEAPPPANVEIPLAQTYLGSLGKAREV